MKRILAAGLAGVTALSLAAAPAQAAEDTNDFFDGVREKAKDLSLIHISEPTRPRFGSRMPSSA